MQVEHCGQVVAVTLACFDAGAFELLLVVGGSGSVREVGDIKLLGFFIHAIEDGMSAPWCRLNWLGQWSGSTFSVCGVGRNAFRVDGAAWQAESALAGRQG
ncbi:hypothetical protein [Mycobacterium senriense]|uniref:hypothetical protein n=1 Tax=Mycobacterium senriense TaxID=2775496 RepID=UPI002022FD2E|nr:hypothetical protein [Mycobacterium senriense]